MRSPEKETELNLLDDVLVEPLDVTSMRSIDLAIDNAISKFERIDVLVNNAGVGVYSIFEEADENIIRESFEINVFGTMWVIRALLPHLDGTIPGESSTLHLQSHNLGRLLQLCIAQPKKQ